MEFSCFITSYYSVTRSRFSTQVNTLYHAWIFVLYVSRLSCLTAGDILQMLVWRFCAWLSWSGCPRWNLCLFTWFQYTIMCFARSPFTWLSSVRWLRLITLSWPAVFTSTTCHWASIKRRPLRESTIYRTGLRVTTFSFFGDSFAWLSAKRCRWIVTTSRFFLHSTPAWLVTLTEVTPLSKSSIYRTQL